MIDFISVPLQHLLTLCYELTEKMGYANYGLAIILITLMIKLVLYPLTVKQVKSMKAMSELQPKMKAIQDKFKDSPENMNKEMAKLYKESGVNPLSGCLPMLVQMPILMGIFFAIRDFTYVQTPSFIWLADLSAADPTYVLPVVSALTTYISQKQVTDTSNQQSKMMLMFMPLFIGYISITFPAGLVLYWVVSNIFQIIQQWFMYKGAGAKA